MDGVIDDGGSAGEGATAGGPVDWDAVVEAVGPRLRALRRQRGLTLTALAAATSIPVSTLSRLERGQRHPSLALLLPIARTLGVTLDDLTATGPLTAWDRELEPDARLLSRPVLRNGITVLPLTRRPGGLQAYKHVLPRRPPQPEPEPRSHEGYHWLYVLNGRLRLHLGEDEVVLLPGEVAEFDTRIPHWLANAGSTPVEYLSLTGPQGERFRVRARYRPR